MGREQNTSPSRGSGYQVINDLFDRQQDFIVVGHFAEKPGRVSLPRRKF